MRWIASWDGTAEWSLRTDGTSNRPAVSDALQATGAVGDLTVEGSHPFPHDPEVRASPDLDALDGAWENPGVAARPPV